MDTTTCDYGTYTTTDEMHRDLELLHYYELAMDLADETTDE